MLSLVKTFNKIFKFKSCQAWNAIYLFKIAIYALGFIDFDTPLNLLVFLLLCLQIRQKQVNLIYRIFISVIALMLFYHDSYLPSVEQMLAQKDNLTNFSLTYIIEFIEGFVNVKMVIALIVLAIFIKYINRYLRMMTVALLCIISTFFVNFDNVKKVLVNDDVIAVNTNSFSENKETLIAQRGGFTKTNLDRYLNEFYETEQKRKLQYSLHLKEDFMPFNVVIINVEGMSNTDLTAFNASNHGVLKRFDLYLSDFNSVTTDKKYGLLRSIFSACGQRLNQDLEKLDAEKCSMYSQLMKIGYTYHSLFDTLKDNEYFNKYLNTIAKLPVHPIPYQFASNPLVKSLDNIDIFKSYTTYITTLPGNMHMSLLNTNLISGIHGNRDYEAKLKGFLWALDNFIDNLYAFKQNTLLVVMPTRGTTLVGDHTQARGIKDIPSKALTNSTVMFKLIKDNHATQNINFTKPTSYMTVAHVIKRMIEQNAFNPNQELSFEPILEDLTLTPTVSENEKATFIKFREKQFYKTDIDSWKEYNE